MKCIIISNSSDGIFRFRAELISKIRTNMELVVYCPNDGMWSELSSICNVHLISINRRGINPTNDIKLIIDLAEVLKKERPDIVLTYTIKPNVYGGIACQLLHVPYIASITGLGTSIENGGILSWISKKLYKIGLGKAKCVFYQNEYNLNFFKQNKIQKGDYRLVPGSGVNLAKYAVCTYPERIFPIKFLFIGRIMRDKGILELLEAVKYVHEKYNSIQLDVIGYYDEDLEVQMRNAASEGYVFYRGTIQDVRPYIRDCHCLILPSYHEGTANVLLEASAMGRPVIASKVPGCQETFDEGITGFGCTVRDAKSLAWAMIKFIELPYAEKKAMGLNARIKMKREYDRNIVVDAYMDQINSCLIATKKMHYIEKKDNK